LHYRQVKYWLLDQYQQHCGLVEIQLLNQGRTLEQHCIKRESGGFTKKASPCTKADLKKVMMYVCTNASIPTDYQDAGLLCLPWYLFGPAVDGNVFFTRFNRFKTSEEQALSLFPDEVYATYPLLALALALITQAAPCAALLSRLPDEVKSAPIEVSASIPLLELLGDPLTPPTQSTASTPSIHKPMYASSAVTSTLKPIACSIEYLTQLVEISSPTLFGVVSTKLIAPRIFDRGAWNLATTNKAFACIYNTPK
ncbi:hypothetical protein PHMEG_00017629, partial [Phytophthora megakarya]